MRCRTACLTALALGAALPAAAGADTRTERRATGALVVSWQGDPARGCADHGVCDTRGTVVVRPRPAQSLSESSGEGPADDLVVDVEAPVVSVRRGDAGTCSDAQEADAIPVAARPRRGGRTLLTLGGEAPFGALTWPGRCGGPLPSDVAAALPSSVVASARLRRGTLRLDLGGGGSFVAGPYRGEVRSTVVLTVRRKRVPSRRADRREDGGPGRRTRRVELLLGYRLMRAEGGLVVEHGPGPEPWCLPLDACDLAGRTDARLRLPEERTRVEVRLEGPARALRTRTVAGALAALRAGRLRAGVGFSTVAPELAVEARSGRPGTPECRDVRPGVPTDLTVARAPGGVTLSVGGGYPFAAADPLRTRCPGPTSQDVAGGGPLASAVVGAEALGARDLTLVLRPGTGGSEAFGVRRSGELRLVLRRERASIRRSWEPGP